MPWPAEPTGTVGGVERRREAYDFSWDVLLFADLTYDFRREVLKFTFSTCHFMMCFGELARKSISFMVCFEGAEHQVP